MKYILIDTSAYENEGFDFHQGYLKIIKDLCKRGEMKLLTHNVIDFEVKKKITEKVNKFSSLINEAKKMPIFYDAASYNILKVFDGKWYSENRFLSYEKFLEDTDPLKLENTGVDLDGIISDYFYQMPPFGEGNKKYEFPDAFVLNSLIKHKFEEGDEIFVISADDDWIKFCTSNMIKSFKNFYYFMSYELSEEEQNVFYTQAIQKWLRSEKNNKKIIDELQNKLVEYIQELNKDFDEVCDESKILELLEVECIYFDTNKKKLSFQVMFSSKLNFVVGFNDYDNACFDKEDWKYYNVEYVRKRLFDTLTGTAVISMDFSFDSNNHVSIKGFDEIDIFQFDETEFEFDILEPDDYDF